MRFFIYILYSLLMLRVSVSEIGEFDDIGSRSCQMNKDLQPFAGLCGMCE